MIIDHKFKEGDRVQYSARFCRNTAQHTGWVPFARGEIKRIDRYVGTLTIAHVVWDQENRSGEEVPEGEFPVNVNNLWPEGKLEPPA